MGCCNEPSVALASPAADPALHVNYTKGMVLGVDDFTQEFAYLSGRGQWAAREMLGYGTTSGLAVGLDDTPPTDSSPGGPRVHVKPGAATVPGGKQVCVPAEQCCVINQWLAKPGNAAKVGTLIDPAASPPQALSLYLTLCHAECTTLPVPIPGDPCRSEDQLMADSRIADDYRLELRAEPPKQTEEDAIRDFIAWLRQVPVIDTSPPPAADEKAWIAGLKAAAKPWFDVMAESPPASPPAALDDYMFDSPPTLLAIGRGQLYGFLKVAFRFWVTALRPLWMARACADSPKPDDDCLLLARLSVPVIRVGGPTGTWVVSGNADAITVDESRRPFLVDLRLLQEWQGSGLEPESYAPPAASGGLPVPAAGGLPVGDGTARVAKPLLGTANPVAVNTAGPQATFSLPESIASSSSPQFAGLSAGTVTATGTLATHGAVQVAVITLGSGQPLPLSNQHYCVICGGNGGQTLTLPPASSNEGRVYIVKNHSPSNNVTIKTVGGDIIDVVGAISKTINADRAATLVSDGVDTWHTIAAV